MQATLGALTILLMIAIVISRTMLLRRQGIQAMAFGKTHKTDFLLPPFALFFVYLILANAFHWPMPAHSLLFRSGVAAWLGVALCLLGLALMLWSVISFGQSFRVGIDAERPDALVTTGAFALSRNPIYTAFALILAGQFLIFPNWIMLLYLAAGFALFHRQVLREEAYLKTHYGQDYLRYCQRVRRYL